MTQLIYAPYERLFKDIMREFDYPESRTEKYVTFSTKEEYVIEMPLLGVTKEDLNLNVEDNKLVINAKSTKTSKFVNKDTSLSFHLKEDIDTNNINAVLENGLLTIKLPKIVPQKKLVNIKIN